jgi:cathepsin F
MRVLSLLLFVLWASCLHAQLSHEWQLFQDFVQRYSKPYANDSKVFETRFSAFKESLQRHHWLNNYEAGNGGSAVYGVNKFSDLTPQEFEERYLNGIKRSDAARDNYHHSPSVRGLETLPEKFDWREKNVIGQIWNQEKVSVAKI